MKLLYAKVSVCFLCVLRGWQSSQISFFFFDDHATLAIGATGMSWQRWHHNAIRSDRRARYAV